LEAFGSGDVAAADELLDPEAISHDPATPAAMQSLRGPEAFKRTVSMYRTGFPDLRMVVDDVVADGDKVVLPGTAKAHTVASSRASRRRVGVGR
jgi:predicted ester cyclase